MPDAVGVVRRGSYRVIPSAEIAAKTISDADRISGAHGTEVDVFELGIRAVDVQAYAGADEDADDRIFDIGVEADGDPDGGLFAAFPDEGWGVVGAEEFDVAEFGAAIAVTECGGYGGLVVAADFAEEFWATCLR